MEDVANISPAKKNPRGKVSVSLLFFTDGH